MKIKFVSFPAVLLALALVTIDERLAPFSAPAFAQESSQAVIAELEKIQKLTEKRTDFSVKFKQEVFSSLMNKVTPSKGTLDFVPPRMFRWEVERPKRREVYVNNEKDFWKYTEATRHAQRLPADAGELEFLDIILKPGTLAKRYQVNPWILESKPEKETTPATSAVMSDIPPAPSPGTLLVKLVPREKTNQDRMYLVIQKQRGVIEELRVVYQNGNRTRVVFEDFAKGSVDKARFEFVPPPGTAIDKM
jgi:outer membrane lipoprotein-sorting protein